jgi:pyrroloquinoline-quinone synthase
MAHTISDDDVDRFLVEMEAEMQADHITMLDAPFLAAAEAGTLTRDQIEEWARQFYAITRDGRLTIGNFYANAPDDPDLRRELVENISEEETGRISGVGMCHMDVFQSLLAAFGISREEALSLESPHGRTGPMGRRIPPDEYYIELAAYGYSVEVPNQQFCERIHTALQEYYGFSDDELRWFSMHALLDADHGEEFRKHARKVAEQPGGLDELKRQTRGLSQLVKDSWNGLGTWESV